jgi:hypothetical protein
MADNEFAQDQPVSPPAAWSNAEGSLHTTQNMPQDITTSDSNRSALCCDMVCTRQHAHARSVSADDSCQPGHKKAIDRDSCPSTVEAGQNQASWQMTVDPGSGPESSGPSNDKVSSATCYEQVDEPTYWTTPRDHSSPYYSDQIAEQRLLSPRSNSFARPIDDKSPIDRPRFAPTRLLEIIHEDVSSLASSPTDDHST